MIAFTKMRSQNIFHNSFHRKNGNASPQVRIDSEHNLQEYTYKKITPCDVCSQVLRGEHIFDYLSSFVLPNKNIDFIQLDVASFVFKF